MGHGALMLGHAHTAVTAAVNQQVMRGSHYGGCHELEVQWAELIQQMVPSAKRVRFAGTGTEATHLAIRIARAYTGRERLLKFDGHFHGWHDGVSVAVSPPFTNTMSAGIPRSVLADTLTCKSNDIDAVAMHLARGDVACVILEPSGGGSTTTPTVPGFLQKLRDLTRQHGTLLIFDEVISGFRYAPGGYQELVGVTPDITTLAKICAGGMPGAAVVGAVNVMDIMRPGTKNTKGRVAQNGTFNANPISAAAAITTLQLLADGAPQKHAAAMAAMLRSGVDDAMRHVGVPGTCYGESSLFNVSFEGLRHLCIDALEV